MSASAPRVPLPRSAAEHRLFGAAAAIMALIAFAGFARSFFLHAYFGSRQLNPLLVWHGLLMSAWLALLVVQSALISARQPAWHARLGWLGAILAAALVPLATLVLVADVRRQLGPADSWWGLLVAFDGLHLLVFVAAIAVALSLRRLPAAHKRLVVFGTLNLLPPALGRLASRWVPGAEVPGWVFFAIGGLVAAFIALDAVVGRRIRAVDLAGGAVTLAASWLTYRAQVG